MNMRPEYMLGHSEFNEFLWATVQGDIGGAPLSVLSALTRLDLDPWSEAARLAALPKDAAVAALAAIIARLPPGIGADASASVATAVRLVELLPRPGRDRPSAPIVSRSRLPLHRLAVGLLLLALAALVVATMLRAPPSSEEDRRPPEFDFDAPRS